MAPARNEGNNDRDHAIAGAVSGFATRFLCQPLDVVKIRFQLQVEPIAYRQEASKYRSMYQAVTLILREEGVLALWKGHVPAQLLSIVYGTAQFYSYNVVFKTSDKIFEDSSKRPKQFVAGSIAGVVATVASFPFDTIRTRLVAQSTNHMVYKGILHSCSLILKDSPKTFFKGLSPTVLQIAPHTGFQFLFYGILTDFYKKYSKDADTTFVNSMLAGSTAGLLAKTIVYPFDLARKRLQIQGFQEGRKGFGKFFECKGLLDCMIVTFKNEGTRGLFKGLLPSQIKAAATTALHFTVYEQSLKALKQFNEWKKSK